MTDQQIEKRNRARRADRAAIAMDLVAMFLEATKIICIPNFDDEEVIVTARELSPKEQSLYHAAVDYLEKLLD